MDHSPKNPHKEAWKIAGETLSEITTDVWNSEMITDVRNKVREHAMAIFLVTVPAVAITYSVGVYKETKGLKEQQALLEQTLDDMRYANDLIDEALDDSKKWQATTKEALDGWNQTMDALKKEVENKKPFYGIGVGLKWVDGNVVVNEVFPKSPGEKAGLLPGDIVTEVNGKNFAGDENDLSEMRKEIRGSEESSDNRMVTLTIKRGDNELSFSLTKVLFQPVLRAVPVEAETEQKPAATKP